MREEVALKINLPESRVQVNVACFCIVINANVNVENIYRRRRMSKSSNRRLRRQKKIMLDRVVCSREQFSFQMCLENGDDIAELFVSGDRELIPDSWCHDAEYLVVLYHRYFLIPFHRESLNAYAAFPAPNAASSASSISTCCD